jgi:RNAse (barnase) inhibitor barstar
MTETPPESTRNLATLLADVARAGVYYLPSRIPVEIINPAGDCCGYRIFDIDLADARDKNSLLKTIAHHMSFPEWFGCNWDALADNLADLNGQPAPGYLVMLKNSETIERYAHNEFITALQIFSAAADEWRERKIALWCLIDTAAIGIAPLPSV